jgi:GT2 family glycosyltransferase
MPNSTIATLITCYNRKQKTLDSLKSLFSQSVCSQVSLSVYLVDDGSTDGTAAAVTEAYPQVTVIEGNGNLFWNGGMRMAFAAALDRDYDYYLWLNDDTLLYPEALKGMLQTADVLLTQGNSQAIVVGSTHDPQTSILTYGGMVRSSWYRPLRFPLVAPSDRPQRCDTLSGNCVLIPRAVARSVGNLDPAFTHYMGDLDYGLRTQQQGGTVWIAPGYIGTCSQNLRPSSWTQTSADAPWYQQWQRLGQPKGLNFSEVTLTPLDEWKVFAQRHAGPLWPVYWLFPYVRLLLLPFGSIFRQFKQIEPTS